MTIAAKTRAAHRMAKLAAVGAVALVLAGTAAAPAAALKRSEAASRAREVASVCQGSGGVTFGVDLGVAIFQTCAYSEDQVIVVPFVVDEAEDE
jgi:hypothetical protein